jgi:hypothetical protein
MAFDAGLNLQLKKASQALKWSKCRHQQDVLGKTYGCYKLGFLNDRHMIHM